MSPRSPVVKGACRALTPSIALPEESPAPPADAPLEDVLADQAQALAEVVEAEAPALMEIAREAASACNRQS